VHFVGFRHEFHLIVLGFTPFIHVGREFKCHSINVKHTTVHLDINEINCVLFLFSIYLLNPPPSRDVMCVQMFRVVLTSCIIILVLF